MHRKLAFLLTAALLAVPAGTIAVASPASAANAAGCTRSVTWTTPPTGPATYGAGAGGSVTLGPVKGGLKVLSVRRNAGWSSRIDTASGNSVDVYFRQATSRIKFEAGIEGANKMQLIVRTCQ